MTILIILIHFVKIICGQENNDLSLVPCSDPEFVHTDCYCTELSQSQIYCTNNQTFEASENCNNVLNVSYVFQYRSIKNELRLVVNAKENLNWSISLISGNCTFDCSGQLLSPCSLNINYFNLTSWNKEFVFKTVSPGYYCVRAHPLEPESEEDCILHTHVHNISSDNRLMFIPPVTIANHDFLLPTLVILSISFPFITLTCMCCYLWLKLDTFNLRVPLLVSDSYLLNF